MSTTYLSPSSRVRKAYWIFFRVAWSYLSAFYLKKILGGKWYEKRMSILHRKNSERVKNGILELQGLFIKVGQLLSIMSNMLPEAFQGPLESLQDKIPARPIADVRKRITTELGKSIEELFSKFEEIPIAAASIGQAHRAVLHNGDEVVVKIQHIDIEEIATVDLRIIDKLIKINSWFFDIKGLDYMYLQISKMIEDELDYLKEAASMTVISRNLEKNENIVIPKVYQAFSTERVLVMSFISGVKVSEIGSIKAKGIDTELLCKNLWQVYSEMVLRDGFYHADPHPGNILVQDDGKIVLLDFGATASLGEEFRLGIPKLIEAAIKNDVETIVETCYSLGFLAEGNDAERLAKQLVNALHKFLKNEAKIDSLDFKNINIDPFNNSIFDLIKEVGLKGLSGSVQIPKDYVLLNRAITLMMGISYTLAPTLNPLDTVRPAAKKYLFESQGGNMGIVKDFVTRNALTLISLPDELHKTLQKARRGELEIRSSDTIQAAKIIQSGIYAFTYAFLSCFSMGVYLYLSETAKDNIAHYGLIAFCVFGFMFLKKLFR